MSIINRKTYEDFIANIPLCYDKCENIEAIKEDVATIAAKNTEIVLRQNIKYASTWLLENDLWIDYENNISINNEEPLIRGRILLVNAGVTNIGREQRFPHLYIVLGEFKESFIGVPITNMAYDQDTKTYYLRHIFEVELKDPNYKKPFLQYRCSKPSVADIRNIRGCDKRRIIVNKLFIDKKFVPETYLNAISNKIRETLAVI